MSILVQSRQTRGPKVPPPPPPPPNFKTSAITPITQSTAKPLNTFDQILLRKGQTQKGTFNINTIPASKRVLHKKEEIYPVPYIEKNPQNDYIIGLYKQYFIKNSNDTFFTKYGINKTWGNELIFKNYTGVFLKKLFINFSDLINQKDWLVNIITARYLLLNDKIEKAEYDTLTGEYYSELVADTGFDLSILPKEIFNAVQNFDTQLKEKNEEELAQTIDDVTIEYQNILRDLLYDVTQKLTTGENSLFTKEELKTFLTENFEKFCYSETYKEELFNIGFMWPTWEKLSDGTQQRITKFYQNNVFSDTKDFNEECAPLFNKMKYKNIKSADKNKILSLQPRERSLFNTCVQSATFLDLDAVNACNEEDFKTRAPNICIKKEINKEENTKEVNKNSEKKVISNKQLNKFNKVQQFLLGFSKLKPQKKLIPINLDKEIIEPPKENEKPKILEKYFTINESLKKFYENINATNELAKQKNTHFIDEVFVHIKKRFEENDTRYLVAGDFEYTNQAKLFSLFENLLNKGLDALHDVYVECQKLSEDKDVHVTNFNNLKFEFEALRAQSLNTEDEYLEKIKILRELYDDSQQDIENFFIKSNEYETINNKLREELNKLKTRNFTLESASETAIKLNDEALIMNDELKKENTELKRDVSNIMLEFNNQVNTLRKLLLDKENSIFSLRDELSASKINNKALHDAHEQIIQDMRREKEELLQLLARAQNELGDYVQKNQALERENEQLHAAELVYLAEKQRVDTLLIEENERFAQKERVYTSQLVLLTKLLAQKKKFFTETENARDVLRIIEDESAEIIRETLAKWYIHKLEKKNTEKERNLQRQIWRETHHGVFQIVEMLDEFITQPLILKNGFKFSVFLKNVGKMCLAIMMMLLLFVPSIKYLSVGQSGSGIALPMSQKLSLSKNAQNLKNLLQSSRGGIAEINENVISQAVSLYEPNAHSTCIADVLAQNLKVNAISADLDKCAKKQEKFERLVEENADIIKELQRLKNADEQNNYDLEMKKSETRDLINEMSELRQEKKTLQTQLEKTTDALSLSQQNVEQMNEHANEQTVRLVEQHSQLQLAQEYAAGNQTRVLQLENEVKTLPSRIVEIIEIIDSGEDIPFSKYTIEEIDAATEFTQLH